MRKYFLESLLFSAALLIVGVCVSSSNGIVRTVNAETAAAAGDGFTMTLTVGQTVCLQNGSTDFITFDTGTGAYTFEYCPTSLTLTGTGVIQNVNGVISLTDSKADRRIQVRYLTNQKTGSATVVHIQSSGSSRTFSINATNNGTCTCAVTKLIKPEQDPFVDLPTSVIKALF